MIIRTLTDELMHEITKESIEAHFPSASVDENEVSMIRIAVSLKLKVRAGISDWWEEQKMRDAISAMEIALKQYRRAMS